MEILKQFIEDYQLRNKDKNVKFIQINDYFCVEYNGNKIFVKCNKPIFSFSDDEKNWCENVSSDYNVNSFERDINEKLKI